MAAQLSVWIKEEQRSMARFLWSEGVAGAIIHQRLSEQYGNSVLPHLSVYEWIEKLKNGCTNVVHDKGAGWPSTAITEDNRWVTIDEVAYVLQIIHGSAYQTMHKKLGFHKVCARWVPKQLTEVHKQTRVDICQKHLDRCGNKRDIFLDSIITVMKHGSSSTRWRVNGRI